MGNPLQTNTHYYTSSPHQSNDNNYDEMSDWDFWNKITDNDGDSSNGYFFNYNDKNWQNNKYLKNLMAKAQIYGKQSFDPNIIKNYARAQQELSKYFNLTSNGYTLKTDSNIDYTKANRALQNFQTQQNLFQGTLNKMRKSQSYIDADGNIVHAFEGDKAYDYNPDIAVNKKHYSGFQNDQEMQEDINKAIKWNSAQYADKVYNKAFAEKEKGNSAGFLNSLSGAVTAGKLATLWTRKEQGDPQYNSIVSGGTKWYGKNAQEAERKWFDTLKDNEKYAYLRWRDSDNGKRVFGANSLQNLGNNKNDYLTSYVKGEGNDDYQRSSVGFYSKYKEATSQQEASNNNFTFNLQFKQGGKMNKYQEGGKATTAAELVIQALEAAQQGDQSGLQKLFGDQKTAQAVITQLQKEAQEGSEEAIQALKALQQIMGKQQGTSATMARKGAKLDYIHRLSTGCPSNSELVYFKKGGRLCRACVKKAEKGIAMTNEKINEVIASNMQKYKGITRDQAAGREPIIYRGQKFYLDGDGNLIQASKKSKFMNGGYINYFQGGGKPNSTVKRTSKNLTDDGYEMTFSDGTSSNYGRNPMTGRSVAKGRDGKTYTGEKADSVLRTDSKSTVPQIKTAKSTKKRQMACGGKASKKKLRK